VSSECADFAVAYSIRGRDLNELNSMSVIGIILLFGLVTKNSILLVDLTIQK